MGQYVLEFQQIDRTLVELVGGKGAHLGELLRIAGVRVPPGFCVTTDAFKRVMLADPSLGARLDQLSRLKPDDREAIRAQSAEIRRVIEAIAIPDDVAAEISQSHTALTAQRAQTAHTPRTAIAGNTVRERAGPELGVARPEGRAAVAVRSSATAEDSPNASFAGQHDSFLNVVGAASVLAHIRRCWASLFTERAVTYRVRNRIDHRTLSMAVVVQLMVSPEASGILFTAEPITGNRRIASIEASFGLGEALLSGVVNPDRYQVQDGVVSSKSIGSKMFKIVADAAGGTRQIQSNHERQTEPALTDLQAVRLVTLGRRIEAHLVRPQDIEWCLADDEILIVQSRPITTLFPIPVAADQENRVYVSVGHQQMMTDAMTPLGLSLWQLTTPRPMAEAGGRLFVDVTQPLSSPTSRANLLGALGKSDPLIRDALQTVLDRGNFIPSLPDAGPAWTPPGGGSNTIATDPAIVAELIENSRNSLAALKRDIQTKSGTELLDFILADIQELRRVLFDPKSMQVIMAGMEATWWLNEQMEAWLGEVTAGFALTQSVTGNVTSEMGLALMDVADVIRPRADVVAFLQGHAEDDDFLDALPSIAGGLEARDVVVHWLDKYGMRGVGEIDITRPRWSERPAMLIPIILGNIKNFEPGAGARRFEQGRLDAQRKEEELVQRLRALPDGDRKAQETKRMIDRVRTFAGYREYPKYGMVSRYFVYKRALMEEAERLVRAEVFREKEDCFYLRFDELQEVVRVGRVNEQHIRERKDAFKSYQALTPPRVLTSDGECLTGVYRRENFPAGALVGLPVSSGIIEGRARVILDMSNASLEPGDILVTRFTDPSWTPLFVAITGLVTEVGGLMTHGAVIAREYGLPAVVGVENATQLIQDGQRIRVDGTEGYVELLS